MRLNVLEQIAIARVRESHWTRLLTMCDLRHAQDSRSHCPRRVTAAHQLFMRCNVRFAGQAARCHVVTLPRCRFAALR